MRNHIEAFDDAIKEGRLSDSCLDWNYAGHYMYMGTCDGHDMFKHSLTRKYLPRKAKNYDNVY